MSWLLEQLKLGLNHEHVSFNKLTENTSALPSTEMHKQINPVPSHACTHCFLVPSGEADLTLAFLKTLLPVNNFYFYLLLGDVREFSELKSIALVGCGIY